MNNIKAVRVRRGMTQQQLADKIGVSVPRISEWENGRYIPNGRHMIRLSEALNTSIDELFTRGCDNVK